MKFVATTALVAACAAKEIDDIWVFQFSPDGVCSYDIKDEADFAHKGKCGSNYSPWLDVQYCLEKYHDHDCLGILTLTTRETDGGSFNRTAACNITDHEAQELNTTNFFIHVPVYQHISIPERETLTVTFDAKATDCTVKLEFLPQLIKDCKDPKKDNTPVATVDVKQTLPDMPIRDVFTNNQSSSILITSPDWSACGDGVTDIKYKELTSIKLSINASSATIALAGLAVVAATAALW